MHPDQAAGAIVDFALSRGIPFALTPCCTYHKEFPKRKLRDGSQVRTYEQLVQYLMEKGGEEVGGGGGGSEEGRRRGRIKKKELDFEGKNVVVYWDPS